MRNSRVTPDSEFYIAPGSTRCMTRNTVIISGVAKIQCCPYPTVDNELDYICKMAVVSTLYERLKTLLMSNTHMGKNLAIHQQLV